MAGAFMRPLDWSPLNWGWRLRHGRTCALARLQSGLPCP